MFVPREFAHGFCVMSDEVDLFYKCSDFYAPGDEYGVLWSDPVIGIRWPSMEMLLSGKDQALPMLADIAQSDLPVY
jgi:dTDP-4-dehydrorhamnose 3,5-epimerase